MMRRTVTAILAMLAVWSSPALAWDPFREEGGYELPEPAPEPDPAPYIAPPPGIYYVTETYVADVVTSSGPLTTYSTSTVHESTGSYARALGTGGTGASSPFDGSAFNGRRALGDGRAVAGTYYENYVLTAGGFVPVSIVFFQDDAEIARVLAATPTPSPITPPWLPTSPAATSRPSPSTCCAPEPSGAPVARPTPSPIRPVRPGISLLPTGAPLASVEVLRARAVSLYPRAFVDEREIPVRSWSIVAGDAGEALVTADVGGAPFRTSWLRLAPPGSAYELLFRIEVDTPETGHRTVDAPIAVVVRSPALER
jgi:hypothetical protein